jgi:hypothetical protein
VTDFILRTESHFKSPPSPPTINWYNSRVRELETLRRSAVVNRMFEGPRLVVEAGKEVRPTLMLREGTVSDAILIGLAEARTGEGRQRLSCSLPSTDI